MQQNDIDIAILLKHLRLDEQILKQPKVELRERSQSDVVSNSANMFIQ